MSNPLYINFKNIADDLQYMVEHHKQINSYGLGDTDQLSYWTQVRDQEPNNTFESPIFPLLYIVPGRCENNIQYKKWEFNCVMLDIVDRDLTNQVDVFSDTLQMVQDVVSQYRLSVCDKYGNFNLNYYVDDTVVFVPFFEEYSDLNNGWNGIMKINTTTPLDRCAAAFNDFTGTTIYHDTINFKTFHDDFRLLADYHKQLNSFGFGNYEDLSYWTESRLKQSNPTFESPFFPLLYVVPSNAEQRIEQNGSSYMEYEFNCIVMDIIDRDLANQVDVLSDTNQILDDIISQFRLSVTQSLGCFNSKYYLDDTIEMIPFLEKYSDLCGGWNAILKIKVMSPLDRCNAAFRPFVTPTTTATPTPTPTNTNTPTTTTTPTNTPSTTLTATPTQTQTPSDTPTTTPTPTTTTTLTATQTSTPTQTPTPTNTNTPTNTQTPSTTLTATPTQTQTSTPTNTASQTNTPTPSITASQTNTPTLTQTPSNTPTSTQTPTNTPTNTNTSSITPTPSITPGVDECIWNQNNINWDIEDLLWDVCPRPTPTPTTTSTNTPTPSKPAITNDYITFTSNTASQTTYTFNDVPIGGDGLIAIVVHNESGVSRPISSATINGTAATIASQVSQGPGALQFTNTGIIYSRVLSGTTANISITFTGAVTRCGIGVYRIQNNISDTPIQTQTSSLTSGTGLTITFTGLTISNVGVCGTTLGIANPVVWSGATENYDVQLVSLTEMSGANFITTSSGNRTITTSHINSTQPLTLVGVVWN